MATGPVLERLLGQLYELGVSNVHVITRAISPDAAADLRAIAASARERTSGVVVAVRATSSRTREALAGLLADARVGNGVLVAAGPAPLGVRRPDERWRDRQRGARAFTARTGPTRRSSAC